MMESFLRASDGFFGWLWRASWQAAILIVLVLLVQWLFTRQLTPRWRHALWLLVVIRLGLPESVESRLSLFNFCSPPSLLPMVDRSDSLLASADASELQTPPTDPARGPTPHWRSWISLRSLWLAGAVAVAVYFLASAWQLGRRIRRQRPVTNEAVLNLLEDCKQEMEVLTPLTLHETASVKCPALLGFIRPRLLLPEGLLRSFSPSELRFVFLHELGHLKRGDILLNWLMAVPLVLHWFNPLVWYAVIRMRVDGEVACDATTLSHAREGENQLYGQTIIKLLERFSNLALAPGLVGILENRNHMSRRIRMIAAFRKTDRWPFLAASLFACLAIVALTDAQSRPVVGGGRPGGSAAATTGQWRPCVIASFPQMGDSEVDPAITELTVTFDRDMSGGYSWTGRGAKFMEEFPPAREGQKVHWRDRRTCVFPVQLQAGHFYRVGINSLEDQNFRGADGRVAGQAVLYFTTRGASEAVKAKLTKPKIVGLTPWNGAANVDPQLNEIRVTFEMPMSDGFSWCGQGEYFPGSCDIRNAYWLPGNRTCVLPVNLKPNHPYQTLLNSIVANNFQSADAGVPSDPFNFTFKTSP